MVDIIKDPIEIKLKYSDFVIIIQDFMQLDVHVWASFALLIVLTFSDMKVPFVILGICLTLSFVVFVIEFLEQLNLLMTTIR